ncbi:MAG: TIGR04053 family radical SAM/SPASM domain-containing protein [Minicystis sp.]
MHHPVARTYDERPLLIFWEMTKACPLACAHCRAHAQHSAMPGELTTAEGERFLDDVVGFGSPSPILVLTGGDPLARPDFFHLLSYAHDRGVKVALAPAVSASLAGERLDRIKQLGVNAISISLDGATAATHEGIRQVPGHFQQTLDKLGELVARGFMVQVNTTVMRRNAEELGDVAVLLKKLGVHVWEVFFLVHVGRGTAVEELTAPECEDVAHFLFDAARYGFVVRTVEGPFFRRVVTWRADAGPDVDPRSRFGLGPLYGRLSARLVSGLGAPMLNPKATSAGTRDGNGILFVAHDGGVCPAGFLPLSLGNVKERNVVDLYRNEPILQAIRRAEFKGRCGACEMREICGGSRSRAFAAFGDALAEDPACAYVPAGTAAARPGVHLTITE